MVSDFDYHRVKRYFESDKKESYHLDGGILFFHNWQEVQL